MFSEHCSYGVLANVRISSAIFRLVLTQVVVVFEAVTQSHQTEDHMPDCCTLVSQNMFIIFQHGLPAAEL